MRNIIVVLAVLCVALPGFSEQKATANDFDYLLGDWEFNAVSQQYGKFRGYWSAVKLAEGQILDEYRVVGDKGETFYVTGTVRSYNKHKDRWDLVGMDRDSGLLDVGTGHRSGNEVFIEQTFGASGDKPAILRIHYYNIKADSFSWEADRSTDGGKTWTKKSQTIEARRIGPARKLDQLTKPKPLE